MRHPLPFRQVHLDFHTSPHIPGVGAEFDPEDFAGTLAKAHVDSGLSAATLGDLSGSVLTRPGVVVSERKTAATCLALYVERRNECFYLSYRIGGGNEEGGDQYVCTG